MKFGNNGGTGCSMSETRKTSERRVSRAEMDELVRAFAPLVASLARRYEGRGAEAEDLRQEGCLGLVRIARSVTRRQLTRAVSHRLPGLVRDAASRMRRPDGLVSLTPTDDEGDEAELYIADGRAEADLADVELRAALERALRPRELALVEALMAGERASELSRRMGVSRAVFRKRLARIAAIVRTRTQRGGGSGDIARSA